VESRRLNQVLAAREWQHSGAGGCESNAGVRPCRGRPRTAWEGRAPSAVRDLQRAYKRDYMRRWHRDPRHLAKEMEARKRWYFARKCREALAPVESRRQETRPARCGLCHARPPVCEVERLRIDEAALGGYVTIRVPYCGVC